ncbi:hypothetical protein CR513_56185, partial [Mucuna pruriens]
MPSPSAPRTSSTICFKCLGEGHIAFQCSNKKAMIVREDGEVANDSSHGETSTSRSQIVEEAKTHRGNIFHSSCHVLGNLYSIIIDGVVTYEDKVLYNLMLMETTHLLLGRPWKYDRKVIHYGVTNNFTFVHMGQKVVLKTFVSKWGSRRSK